MSNDNIKKHSEEILQLVTFKLGNEEFGVEILHVSEILRMLEVTAVPNTPECIEGIVNVRGKVIPVLDTRLKLNMLKQEHGNKTRVIVVEIDNKTVGFIVDEVNEVLRISQDITESPPDLVTANVDSDYITSIAKLEERLIIILDLKRLVHSEDFEPTY
jgi:purine-binding chemotaxis protein CheW